MAKFLSESERKKMRKETKNLSGSAGLNPQATALERAKYSVCEQMLIYMKKKKLNQREFSKLLDIPETRVSEIVHYRIEKFTLDRLIEYLQQVKPMLMFRVA